MNLLTTLSDAASQIASWVNRPTYSYVRALWMPDPYIEGFAPLRFAVPLGPNYLPIWIDHFFIEKQLYMRSGIHKLTITTYIFFMYKAFPLTAGNTIIIKKKTFTMAKNAEI